MALAMYASLIFPGSPFRRSKSSFSAHFNFFNPALTILSAFSCPLPILFVPENVFPPISAIYDARRAEAEREGGW